ncbi:MAG: hypothetical protein ACXWKM_04105 [Phenylobacterium sp.]
MARFIRATHDLAFDTYSQRSRRALVCATVIMGHPDKPGDDD